MTDQEQIYKLKLELSETKEGLESWDNLVSKAELELRRRREGRDEWWDSCRRLEHQLKELGEKDV